MRRVDTFQLKSKDILFQTNNLYRSENRLRNLLVQNNLNFVLFTTKSIVLCRLDTKQFPEKLTFTKRNEQFHKTNINLMFKLHSSCDKQINFT